MIELLEDGTYLALSLIDIVRQRGSYKYTLEVQLIWSFLCPMAQYVLLGAAVDAWTEKEFSGYSRVYMNL